MNRAARGLAVVAAVLVLAGGCGGDDSEDVVETTTTSSETNTGDRPSSVTILSPEDGAEVRGNVVSLDVDVDGIRIVQADGDDSGRTGHYHVFIDKDPVPPGADIPREPGILHSADDPVEVTGLSVGQHRLTVVLGNGQHVRLGDAEAQITVDVKGPSIDARAPATARAGTPVKVETEVEGLQIQPGGTHLHLFVDRDPTPAGMPIPVGDPTIIHTPQLNTELPDLGPGQHVITVVAGDAAHVPLDPPVMDKVSVTVQP